VRTLVFPSSLTKTMPRNRATAISCEPAEGAAGEGGAVGRDGVGGGEGATSRYDCAPAVALTSASAAPVPLKVPLNRYVIRERAASWWWSPSMLG
jgi:hypothetical protein